MVGALVPMVPEGLVLLTSLAFARRCRPARAGGTCLVQELPAIEGLARVDVVCADKTGTLTENGMTFGELELLDGADARARAVLAQLAAADPASNASVQAIGRGVGPLTGAVAGDRRGAVHLGQEVVRGARSTGEGNWVLGAPDVLVEPDARPPRQAEQIARRRAPRAAAGRARPRRWTPPTRPGPVTPRALVVLEQKVRPDARGHAGLLRRAGRAR